MSSLLSKLKKNTTLKHVDTMAESSFFNGVKPIKTEVPILNLALSGSLHGGVMPGLITVAAPSKHFKSGLSLYMVSAYLKAFSDAVCLFYDAEFGSPPAYLNSYGIDLDRVLHTPITNIEDLRTDITNQLEGLDRNDKVIIFIDSIGNLASKKETKDAIDGSEKADFTRAKVLKSMFRIITPQLLLKNIPCIVINHVYNSMELFSKQIMSGGCVVADTQIKMADGTLKSVQDIIPGEFVKTLTGSAEVTHSWNPDTLLNGTPECIELTFDDGYTVITSDTHKFLCSKGDQYEWIEAKDLTEDHDIVKI
jgi:RecA/RadA recombinase